MEKNYERRKSGGKKMSEKVLGFKETDVWFYKKTNKEGISVIEQFRVDQFAKQVPVVSVDVIKKRIRKCPCRSCEYFADWLKELKQLQVAKK